MTTTVAFPDPQSMTAAQVKDLLPARAHAWRESIEEAGDADRAVELHRQLEALRTYLSDREAAETVEAESRRTEVLIGKLLGPSPGAGRPLGGNCQDLTIELHTQHRVDFRQLADHEEAVEELLSQGIVKRAALLREIGATPKPEYGYCPTCGHRLRKDRPVKRRDA